MKKALIVGINSYSPQKPLRGCLNDAADLANLLGASFGFQNITTLRDSEVSAAVLRERLETLLRPDPGETDAVRYFHFSGHGGRVYDREGDEPDTIDENLCMGNYVWSDPASYLVDDLLGDILHQAHENAPTMRVYVTLDACHSGTGTRDVASTETWEIIDNKSRQVFGAPPEELHFKIDDGRLPLLVVSRQADDPPELINRLADAERPPPAGSKVGAATAAGEPNSHLLLSGCAAFETCKDAPIEGRYNGVFSYALVHALRADPSMSWRDLHEVVTPVVAAFIQRPQLEGPDPLKTRRVFS